MGADAEVFIFDEAKYSHETAPDLEEFLFNGKQSQWLRDLIPRIHWEFDFTGIRNLGFRFSQECKYLSDGFASRNEQYNWSESWNARSCKISKCNVNLRCPFFCDLERTGAFSNFNVLHESAVMDQCLGESQFVGRSLSPIAYRDVLRQQNVGEDHCIWKLLRKLEYRGFVVGYQGSNSDGIHGWLNLEETELLLDALDQIHLPRFEPTKEKMLEFRKPGRGYIAPDPFDFLHLSLAFVRSMARIAIDHKMGILWGNDVCSID